MKVIDVIPIAKGISLDTLSYFTSIDVEPGALVEVPLRSKKISALVVGVHSASSMRSELRNATFAIKKVETLKATSFLSKEFIAAAHKAAEYFATSPGAVLHALIPKVILDSLAKLALEPKPPRNIISSDVLALQGDDEDRMTSYRSLIRQEFARKSSVFIVVPTIEDARRVFSQLEKGIHGYCHVLHGGLTKKAAIETWNTVQHSIHPVAIIATGSYLCVPRADISTYIIEREHSRSYKIPIRPYLDIRTMTEFLACEMGATAVMGDLLLRNETLWRKDQGLINESSPFKSRSFSTAKENLIDMRAYSKSKGGFKIVSEETEALITATKEQSKLMFIYATRRGLSPSVVCGDCQNIVTCSSCSSPVVLHKTKNSDKTFFLCHRCGERRSADETCGTCGSWKLATVGIGIDLVYDKIRDRFPTMKIWKIDADSTQTDKAALETARKFYDNPGSILVGTEMALQYLSEPFNSSAIISLDPLFSIPDFRIGEKILHNLLTIRSKTTETMIIQTRRPDEAVFDFAMKGNLADFYRFEIEQRKAFKFPPFYTLIKITLEGERTAISLEMQGIQNLLEPYEVEIFPAFTHTVRGKFVLHGLVRVERSAWIDPVLLDKLRTLPPHITVKVDPDSLL